MAQIHNIVKKTPGGKLSMKSLEALGLPDPVRNIGEKAEADDEILKRKERQWAQSGKQGQTSLAQASTTKAAGSSAAAPVYTGGAERQRKNKSLLGG